MPQVKILKNIDKCNKICSNFQGLLNEKGKNINSAAGENFAMGDKETVI